MENQRLNSPVRKVILLPCKSVLVIRLISFMVAKQNQTGQSQIFGGDLFTTNEYGLFTLNYNSQNPFIPPPFLPHPGPFVYWELNPISQNLWVNGELMGSAASSLNPNLLIRLVIYSLVILLKVSFSQKR